MVRISDNQAKARHGDEGKLSIRHEIISFASRSILLDLLGKIKDCMGRLKIKLVLSISR